MAKKLSLGDSFQTFGEWFLPENPERKIAGTLSYGDKGVELEIQNAFVPLRGLIDPGGSLQTYAVVMGTTRESEAMTIFNAQRAGMSFTSGSGGHSQPEKLISPLLIVGAHVPHDFEYPAMSFRIPGLQVWFSRTVIHELHDKDEVTGKYTHSYSVDGIELEIFYVPLIAGKLEFGYQWTSNTDPFSSVDVKVTGWVTVRPDKPKEIHWYLDKLRIITSMLTFISGTSMSPDCIQADIGQKHHDVTCLISFANRKCCDYKNHHDFFLLHSGLGVDLNDVINRWFDVYQKVNKPSELAISVLSSEDLWLHVKFLSLMQALEGFHRALYDGNYMDEKEYTKVKKSLGDAIPEIVASDHKEALKSRIKYGNQIALRKRLDFLVGLFPEKIRRILLGPDGKVPRSWIDTRNYYTHWDEELTANVLDYQEMYDTNVRMMVLLRVLYLALMGIPDESILGALSKYSRDSQHLVQINARALRKTGHEIKGVIVSTTEQPAEETDKTLGKDLSDELPKLS